MSDKNNDGLNLMDFADMDDDIIKNMESAEAQDELEEIINDDHIPDTPPTEAEFDKAAELISTSDEVAAQNKAELDELESPLIVHKKSDASYQETASDVVMEETHVEEDAPTLTRHRFRKEKTNNHTGLKVFIIILVICAVVFAGLYYGGVIKLDNNKETKPTVTTEESTTSLEQKYEGKIVVKGMYIFVDGVEVNGIEGLQSALKYVEPSPTAYEIVKENADAIFLNDNILPLMSEMGFYDETTVISTIAKTGLIAEAEKTTKATTKPITKKATTKATTEAE